MEGRGALRLRTKTVPAHNKNMLVSAATLFETPEEIFLRVFSELRPRTKRPAVHIEYCRFANANSFIRWHEDRLSIRITDILEGAPAPIMESLAYILITKLLRRPTPKQYADRYRRYLNRNDMRRTMHLVRQTRGRKFVSGAKGSHYDLEEIFQDLNFRYFHGLMAQPLLGWSRRPSRTLLGHFDPSHNAIIISKMLDNSRVPKLALEFVMFHEMLHLRFPVEHRGVRRCVHTPEFKTAERQFDRWQAAKELLKKL
jgi:hypothetical protein